MAKFLASWKRLLPLSFGAAISSFGASTVFTQYHLRAIDAEALSIAENAVPSMQNLAEAYAELRQLRSLFADHARGSGRAPDVGQLAERRERIDRALNAYLALPVFPREQSVYDTVVYQRRQLNDSLQRLENELARSGPETTAAAVDMRARAEQTLAATFESLKFNAMQSHDLAVRIAALRDRWARVAFGLNVLSILLTVSAAVLAARAVGAHTALLESHAKLIERRAEELEQFAGRVAHDIRGPLSAVALAMQSSAKAADEHKRREVLRRGTSSLQRVTRIVDGLLAFARAGAQAEKGATADLRSVLDDMATELVPLAADAQVQLAFESFEPCVVACSPGVLMSMTGNLARNAIKYIGQAPTRRVTVRVKDRGSFVRVEVDDTGPGLAPEIEGAVFDPYVGGKRAGQPGIGLGLATVKRLAEGHGGRVGFSSRAGEGCLFWFELPKAQGLETTESKISGSA